MKTLLGIIGTAMVIPGLIMTSAENPNGIAIVLIGGVALAIALTPNSK